MYQLIDHGDGMRFEQFGEFKLIRPCSQALWSPSNKKVWDDADATFSRASKEGWTWKKRAPKSWDIEVGTLKLHLKPTPFGHLGLFPEHQMHWEWASKRAHNKKVLNLFAYSGALTSALAQNGASLCHLDSAKGMVTWAKENATLNGLADKPIRWIVDDAMKFIKREVNRGSTYDGIVLDPPTFGRGNQGQVFKIEEALPVLLEACQKLLAKENSFLLLTSHTPHFTPLVMENMLKSYFPSQTVESGETTLSSKYGPSLPCGTFARFSN